MGLGEQEELIHRVVREQRRYRRYNVKEPSEEHCFVILKLDL